MNSFQNYPKLQAINLPEFVRTRKLSSYFHEKLQSQCLTTLKPSETRHILSTNDLKPLLMENYSWNNNTDCQLSPFSKWQRHPNFNP